VKVELARPAFVCDTSKIHSHPIRCEHDRPRTHGRVAVCTGASVERRVRHERTVAVMSSVAEPSSSALIAAQESTIQATYLDKRLNVGKRSVKLMIWDTAGQERFHALGQSTIRRVFRFARSSTRQDELIVPRLVLPPPQVLSTTAMRMVRCSCMISLIVIRSQRFVTG
jgi:hypothetical protein